MYQQSPFTPPQRDGVRSMSPSRTGMPMWHGMGRGYQSPRIRPSTTPDVNSAVQVPPGVLPSHDSRLALSPAPLSPMGRPVGVLPQPETGALGRIVHPSEPVFGQKQQPQPQQISHRVSATPPAQPQPTPSLTVGPPEPSGMVRMPSGGRLGQQDDESYRLASQIVKDVRQKKQNEGQQQQPTQHPKQPQQLDHFSPVQHHSDTSSPPLSTAGKPKEEPAVDSHTKRPSPLKPVTEEQFSPPPFRDDAVDSVTIKREPGEDLGLRLDNLVVTGVRPGSPADKHGLSSFKGRRLTHMNNKEIQAPDDVLLSAPSPKKFVKLTFENESAALVGSPIGDRMSYGAVAPPNTMLKSPRGSSGTPIVLPAGLDETLQVDTTRDPRNGLPFVDIPESLREYYPLTDAVVYFLDTVEKVHKQVGWGTTPRLAIITDDALYLCKGPTIKRTIHFSNVKEMLTGDDLRVGLRMKEKSIPQQYDVLLQMKSVSQRDLFCNTLRNAFEYRMSEPLTILNENDRLNKSIFNMSKPPGWLPPKPLQSTSRSELIKSAQKRSTSLRRARSAASNTPSPLPAAPKVPESLP